MSSVARAEDEPDAPAHPPPGPKTLGAVGWGLAALGVGGLTTSVVTFVLHADTAERVTNCSRLGYSPIPFPERECDLQTIQSKLDGLEAANITAFSLGLAAAGAGVTMILVDHLESLATPVSVAVSPTGAALRVGF